MGVRVGDMKIIRSVQKYQRSTSRNSTKEGTERKCGKKLTRAKNRKKVLQIKKGK